MDKALACHAGGWGLNLDKSKEDFSARKKFQNVLLAPWVPHHVLSLCSGLFLRELGVTCFGDICGGETQK